MAKQKPKKDIFRSYLKITIPIIIIFCQFQQYLFCLYFASPQDFRMRIDLLRCTLPLPRAVTVVRKLILRKRGSQTSVLFKYRFFSPTASNPHSIISYLPYSPNHKYYFGFLFFFVFLSFLFLKKLRMKCNFNTAF